MAITQANRALRVQTPLGTDKLIITRFNGSEEISQLFEWHLDLLAENATKVEFDKLIGQKITVELEMPSGKTRYFHGICNRLAEGKRDSTFTHYKMEVVPQFWLLCRRTQCRIFQQINVPDILKQVLKGLDVKFELSGKYPERDYCVQYRETDFDFANRLMEDEGIYYYFQHDKKGHTMIVADTPQSHVDVPEFNKAIFDDLTGGNRPEMRVTDWEKVQELRSGKVTLWDNCFELPQQHLDTQKTIQETVAVGKVTHKLKVADNDKLELYDYPGGYAQRFDGIDPGGGARPADLKKIFEENARVAKLRIEQEACESLEIRGSSNCRQFTAGEKFTLERHFDADGQYVLTSVEHSASYSANYRSGEGEELKYTNSFTCIPLALPYRPALETTKAAVQGTQTATVVGPKGETIFCDKYGRVKVQFHWDRQGKKDANSSCWIRVSQAWGGGTWGAMTIPHVGQEVIVDFEEGDPDRPLVIGRVYNAECMPPLTLPGHKTKTIIRDHGGNQIFMEGDAGKESIVIGSPCGKSGFSIGFLPPTITPIGAGPAEYQKLLDGIVAADKAADDANKAHPDSNDPHHVDKDHIQVADQGMQPNLGSYNPKDHLPSLATTGAAINVFSEGQWNSHIQGDYGHVTQGATTSTYVGEVKSLYVSNVYTECWANNDTIVKGNYTCRVNGYQEYFTKGHYVTKVLGANWVTIVGADTNLYLSVQSQLCHGAKIGINMSKELFKTPDQGSHAARMKKAWGDLTADVGKIREKVGEYRKKIGGTYDIAASTVKTKASKWGGELKDVSVKGSKAVWDFGGTVKTKAGEVIHDAKVKITKLFKHPNIKGKP